MPVPTYTTEQVCEQVAQIPPGMVRDVLMECLAAEIGLPNGDVRPDYRARLDAAKTILAYRVGRPAEAPPQEERPSPEAEAAEMQEAMRRSPAMRAALRAAIDRAEAEAPKRGRPRKPVVGDSGMAEGS